jgi:K+-transporting ATPase ATPase C chain
MNFKDHLKTAILMTVVTTVLLGLVYPLVVTGLAQAMFKEKANGQIVEQNGHAVGSRILGQPFTGAGYFHPRPSAAGNGYDPLASGGSYDGPTNKKLVDRVAGDVAALQAENPKTPIPIDLVTASGSGLDPDITPAAAEFQIPRIARERRVSEAELRGLVKRHTKGRTLGILGEPRVNVLALNLALDERKGRR